MFTNFMHLQTKLTSEVCHIVWHSVEKMCKIHPRRPLCHLYFLLPISRESIFLGQIVKRMMLMDLHVLRFTESENKILSDWCVCVRLYLLSD